MKLFTSSQISNIDNYTVENEPILSINLMERAVRRLFERFKILYDQSRPILVFVGPGNNGGDGIALARMLLIDGYHVTLYIAHEAEKISNDSSINLERLRIHPRAVIVNLAENDASLPAITGNDVVIDAIFGAGLSRPLADLPLRVVEHINISAAEVLSIDVPTGFSGEDNGNNQNLAIIKASRTITFQFPRISFMVADRASNLGQWEVLDIGLHKDAIRDTKSEYNYLLHSEVQKLIKNRELFAHKGIFGHALIVAGSYGMMGAAVLASKACIRSGVGLVTVHVPKCGYAIMQSSVPEVIASVDVSEYSSSSLPDMSIYNAIAAGSGLGVSEETLLLVKTLIASTKDKSLLLDADALNVIANHKELLKLLPANTILTPHPGEFDRLTKSHTSSWDRMRSAIDLAVKFNIIVILKGQHTLIATPAGEAYFNSTGNNGMATAGSGDVLSGVVVSLLAQGYSPVDAALAGVYLHGLAGDLALNDQSEESMIASDIIAKIGAAFTQIKTI